MRGQHNVTFELFRRIAHVTTSVCARRNFETVPVAMMTLFGMATKDSAVCIIHACMLEEGAREGTCTEAEGNCGDITTAKVFFAIYDFTLMVTTIEMFVNVILAKYEEMSELDSLPITSLDLNKFRKLWTSYDPSATRWITDVQLEELFTKLDKHIGYDELAGEETLETKEMRLPDLPNGDRSGYVEGLVRNEKNAAVFGNWDDSSNVFDNPVVDEQGTPVKAAESTFEEEGGGTNEFDMDDPASDVGMYNFYEILCDTLLTACSSTVVSAAL